MPAALAGDDPLEKAKRALDAALRAKDVDRARAAIGEVAAAGDARAARALIATAPAARELELYADLVAALARFQSDDGVHEIAEALREHKDWSVRYLLAEAAARIERDAARAALFAAFDDKHESVAACAMRSARARRLKAAVTPLVDRLERLEKRDPDGRLLGEARRALEGITGQSFTSGGDWRRWWAENEARFAPKPPSEKGDGEAEDESVVTRVRDRGESEYLERVEKGDIIVVGGQSDQCEDVLTALKLPFTLLERAAARAKLATLDPRSVLVFNCEGDLENGVLKGEEAKALATFVEKGGYLFTSDWALLEVLSPAVPGYLSALREMPDHVIEVKIGPARGVERHPLLRDVFPENPYARAQARWKIDNLAYTFKCGPKAAALVESPELEAKGGSPTVAATFRAGRGAVLHVLGHFHMQQDKGGDGFALQQLLVNFIVEKQKFRSREAGKKK